MKVWGYRGGMRVLGGRYRLESKVGVGGMGSVWQAHDGVLMRRVAVKLITDGNVAGRTAFERARHEAIAGAQFSHPNVVAVYDFGTSRRAGRGTAFLVLEFVDGVLLSDQLHATRLDWRIAVRVCAEVSAGLAAAHAAGIVHRDIKPVNVVLTDAGAKILDFGVAATIGRPDPLGDGFVVGTPAYIAPERLRACPVTPAVDMYAFGALLYRTLTGRVPWRIDTADELFDLSRYDAPPPTPVVDGVPDEVVEICLACLDPDPTLRPTSTATALILAAAVDAHIHVPSVVRHHGHQRTAINRDAPTLDVTSPARRRPRPRPQ